MALLVGPGSRTPKRSVPAVQNVTTGRFSVFPFILSSEAAKENQSEISEIQQLFWRWFLVVVFWWWFFGGGFLVMVFW
jgi:hypothetical protein